MAEKSDPRKWDMVAVIISIISLIATIVFSSYSFVLANQANSLTAKSLELQNMLSNFTSVITAKPQVGFLYSNTFNNASNLTTVNHYGHLNVSLEVITPHYGKISIEVKNLTDIDPHRMMNPSMKNQTTVSYVWADEKFEKTVFMGLNSFTADLELKATTYPDYQQLPAKGESITIPIGRLLLEARLLDSDANRTTTIKEFYASIAVIIFIP